MKRQGRRGQTTPGMGGVFYEHNKRRLKIDLNNIIIISFYYIVVYVYISLYELVYFFFVLL